LKEVADKRIKRIQVKKKLRVTEKQRKAKLAWAKEHLHWTPDDWKKVIFSDESTSFRIMLGISM